jgi:hypothetical protein
LVVAGFGAVAVGAGVVTGFPSTAASPVLVLMVFSPKGEAVTTLVDGVDEEAEAEMVPCMFGAGVRTSSCWREDASGAAGLGSTSPPPPESEAAGGGAPSDVCGEGAGDGTRTSVLGGVISTPCVGPGDLTIVISSCMAISYQPPKE